MFLDSSLFIGYWNPIFSFTLWTLNTAFASEKYFLLLKFLYKRGRKLKISFDKHQFSKHRSQSFPLVEYSLLDRIFWNMLPSNFIKCSRWSTIFEHPISMVLYGVISRMANATRPDRPESNLILVEQIIRRILFDEYSIPIYNHLLSIYLSLLNLIKNHQ